MIDQYDESTTLSDVKLVDFINIISSIVDDVVKSKHAKKKLNTTAKTSDIVVNIPAFVKFEVWEEFVQHRKQIKKPLTAIALQRSIKQMFIAHANGWDVNELLKDAVLYGYQGFFFDKHKKKIEGKGLNIQQSLVMNEDESVIDERQALKQQSLEQQRVLAEERDRLEYENEIKTYKECLSKTTRTPSNGWFSQEVWEHFVDFVFDRYFPSYTTLIRARPFFYDLLKETYELNRGIEDNDMRLRRSMQDVATISVLSNDNL